MSKPLVAGLAALCLSACSSVGSGGSALIPNDQIRLTANTSVKLAEIATGALLLGAIYVVYDPLAPNWNIEQTRLTEDTFRLSMTMKRFHTGGAGESLQLLKRRAALLQGELGYGGYELMEYTEGIDSRTLGARRVAEGTIRLVQQRQVAADSFLQNDR